jgi:peptide/nickel transport system permease protein
MLALVALLAPLIANDRPLILAAAEVSFPAFGELPLAGRAIERPGWANRDWTLRTEGERWRLPAPIPHSYRSVDLTGRTSPPSRHHLLGTDTLGRDVAARLVHGAGVTLRVALSACLVALAVGLLAGALAGFRGGAIDFVVSRAAEAFLSFPSFFLILAVLAYRKPSLPLLFALIGLTRWPSIARYARAEILRLRELGYLEAARATGAGPVRLLVRHLLPHALTPVAVAASFQLAGAMLMESGLSFLGFGVPEPLPSWGGMLSQARGTGMWWLILFPGLALTIAVAGAQFLGEDLRSRLSPHASPP